MNTVVNPFIDPPERPANDNQPKRYLLGIGNTPWVVSEAFGELSADEVMTASKPLRALHRIVSLAVDMMRAGEIADECSVYVIGDVFGRQCKIGKAVDPVARLAQLQTGNPNLLFLHRVFWMGRNAADLVEMAAHGVAENRHVRLQGEWFMCSPDEAHFAIEDAIVLARNVGSYCVMTPSDHLMSVAA